MQTMSQRLENTALRDKQRTLSTCVPRVGGEAFYELQTWELDTGCLKLSCHLHQLKQQSPSHSHPAVGRGPGRRRQHTHLWLETAGQSWLHSPERASFISRGRHPYCWPSRGASFFSFGQGTLFC